MTSVALIGLGPRGLVVLDTLVRALAQRPLVDTLHLIDPGGPGQGAVWDTEQPAYLMMNTDVTEVTLFPAARREGTDFLSWLGPAAPQGVRSRAEYGGYLRWAYDRILADVPPAVTVIRSYSEAASVTPTGNRFTVTLNNGDTVPADHVVVCIGYGTSAETATPGLSTIDSIEQGRPVGVIGMGLGFFDLMATATIGRGGRFEQVGGGPKYVPSGAEPTLYVGCRSGLPARSKVSAAYLGTVRPSVVTAASIRTALDAANPVGALHNLLDAEFNVSRRVTVDTPWLPLRRVLDPFQASTFSDPGSFQSAAMRIVLEDIEESDLAWSKDKAGFAALRSCRELIRRSVEFSSLEDLEFRREFRSIGRLFASTVGGPPAFRIKQFAALVDAGVIRLVGPDVEVVDGGKAVRSPRVTGSLVMVDDVIQARLPEPSTLWKRSPLLRGLQDVFSSTEVSPDLAVVNRSGQRRGTVYLVGYPTEGQRWFTQVGNAPPGSQTALTDDACRVVTHLLG